MVCVGWGGGGGGCSWMLRTSYLTRWSSATAAICSRCWAVISSAMGRQVGPTTLLEIRMVQFKFARLSICAEPHQMLL
eukprot:SAG31_NODE_1682_length_7537_cov_4.810164_11_plen_78_part_00